MKVAGVNPLCRAALTRITDQAMTWMVTQAGGLTSTLIEVLASKCDPKESGCENRSLPRPVARQDCQTRPAG